jgi:hypothetical protein
VAMIKIVASSNSFALTQETRKTNGKKFYRVSVKYGLQDKLENIRDTIDPLRSKSGKYGRTWKFSSRKDAEKYYMLLVLQWSN